MSCITVCAADHWLQYVFGVIIMLQVVQATVSWVPDFSQPSLLVSPLISLLETKTQTKNSQDQLIFNHVSTLVTLAPLGHFSYIGNILVIGS